MVDRKGNGWPPPFAAKIPTSSRFLWLFYRMSTRGLKTKLTESDQTDQITPPPYCKTCFSTSEFFWHSQRSLGQILKEVGRPPLLFFLLIKFPHFPIFLGWASLSQLIFVSELVKSDLKCSNMIGIYMIPLCPFVNSILHVFPALDTRMVFEAAGDYTWKNKML